MKQINKPIPESSKKNRIKARNELLLVSGLLIFITGLFIGNKLIHRQDAGAVEISVNGVVTETCDLHAPADIIIQGANGGSNRLIIQNGTAFITEASCPDKVCVRQGTIREAGQSLVCLPNKVIVTIK